MTNDHLPCYVVNLRSDRHRKMAIKEMLAEHGIKPVFFDAVNGYEMQDHEIKADVNWQRMAAEYGVMARGEIGCALSHIGIYRDIVEKRHAAAVVLEDDIRVDNDFSALLDLHSNNNIVKFLSKNKPQMIQLSGVRYVYRYNRKDIGGKRKLSRPYGGVWSTTGYVINYLGAQELSNNLYPVWTVADHWGRFQEKGLIQLRALVPPVVHAAENSKTSHLSGNRGPRTKKKKLTVLQRLSKNTVRLARPLWAQKLSRFD